MRLALFALCFFMSANAAFADARENFSNCLDKFVHNSLAEKIGLADFAAGIAKVCNQEATQLIHGDDEFLTGESREKMRRHRADYVADSRIDAMAYYSKMLSAMRK